MISLALYRPRMVNVEALLKIFQKRGIEPSVYVGKNSQIICKWEESELLGLSPNTLSEVNIVLYEIINNLYKELKEFNSGINMQIYYSCPIQKLYFLCSSCLSFFSPIMREWDDIVRVEGIDLAHQCTRAISTKVWMLDHLENLCEICSDLLKNGSISKYTNCSSILEDIWFQILDVLDCVFTIMHNEEGVFGDDYDITSFLDLLQLFEDKITSIDGLLADSIETNIKNFLNN